MQICEWIWGKLYRGFKAQRVDVKEVEWQIRNLGQSKILELKISKEK